MKWGGVRWILALVWALALTGMLNAGTGLWALKRLEKKAGTPIRGTFLPHFLHPAFTLRNVELSWQGRFEVLSGTVRIHYHPLAVLVGRRFRVQMEGSNLVVRFLQDSAFPGVHLSEVPIGSLTADFAVSQRKTPEIFALDVHSPELEFHFAGKNRNLVKQASPRTEN